MSFYYKEISRYFLYENISFKSIEKLSRVKMYYNSVISNFWYNPYDIDILSKYSMVLNSLKKKFSLKNFVNIKKNI